MYKITEENVTNLIKESYAKKYNKLYSKFQRNNIGLAKHFKDIAEEISINIEEIYKATEDLKTELNSMPLAYLDITEEVNKVTDQLILKVQNSLDNCIRKYSLLKLNEMIQNLVYQTNRYKTSQKDSERFERIEKMFEEHSEKLNEGKFYVDVTTNPDIKDSSNALRTVGVIKFKKDLVVFSINSLDLVKKDGNILQEPLNLFEIGINESVIKSWEIMFEILQEELNPKTAKELEAFETLKECILSSLDLRIKVA